MKLRAFGATNTGRRRDHNEDAFAIDERTGLAVVADGMGGHAAGEVASAMVVAEVWRQLDEINRRVTVYGESEDERARGDLLAFLPALMQRANEIIHQESLRDPDKAGMGTTAVLFVPAGSDAFVCHVGDSRLYLLRSEQLYQVTEDHSLVMQLYKSGEITLEEAAVHPRKNVLMKALGVVPTVEADVNFLDIYPGDEFLLCSDGLSDMLTDDEIARLMVDLDGGELVVQAVQLANDRGGKDNITAVVVEVLDDQDRVYDGGTEMMGLLDKVNFLQDIVLFHELSSQDCIKINSILYERRHLGGEVIIEKGTPGDALYLVAQGSVEVWRGNVRLAKIGAGGHFGEMSLVDEAPHSATVVAAEDLLLFLIRRSDLYELLDNDMALSQKILRALLSSMVERVRTLSDFVST